MKKRTKIIVVISCVAVLASLLLVNCFALVGPGETYPVRDTLISGVTVEWNKSTTNMPDGVDRNLIVPYYSLPVSNGFFPGGVDSLIVDSTTMEDVVLPYVDIDNNFYIAVDVTTTQTNARNSIEYVFDEYPSDTVLGDNPIRSIKVDVADATAHNGVMPYIALNTFVTGNVLFECSYVLYVPCMFSIERDGNVYFASIDVPIQCYKKGNYYTGQDTLMKVGDIQESFTVPDIIFNGGGGVNELPDNFRIEGFTYTDGSNIVTNFLNALQNKVNTIQGVEFLNSALYSIYYRDCSIVYTFSGLGSPFDFGVVSGFPGTGMSGTPNYTSNTGEIVVEEIQVEPFEWLMQTIQGVLDTELFGSITIGHLLMVAIAVPLLLAILRAIAGG